MTDTVNVPRGWLEKMLASNRLYSFEHNEICALLAAAPKAEPVVSCKNCGTVRGATNECDCSRHDGSVPEWEAVHIIFDGPPSPEGARFVEFENSEGRSVNVGKWSQRGDGLWQLAILVTPPAPASDELLEALDGLVDRWDNDEIGTVSLVDAVRSIIAKHKGPQS